MIPGVLDWKMPGRSHRGPLEPLSERESDLADELRRYVETLADDIGPRNTAFPEGLRAAEEFIQEELRAAGCEPRVQEFRALLRPAAGNTTYTPPRQRKTFRDPEGIPCRNFEVELPAREDSPRANEIFVVGAHYDSVFDCPGANDNGTGAAAVLALAKALAGQRFARTLRLVLFVNEEPPYFRTEYMGSRVYADACAERGDHIVGMLNLETIGYYSDEPRSQKYPPGMGLLYPSAGDFIGFVGDLKSRKLIRQAVGLFRRRAKFPSEGVAASGWLGAIGASDHASFWRRGWPALMVTDTAPLRYEHYHTLDDTPDKVDFERTARVVAGLEGVARDFADGDAEGEFA